MAALFNPLSHQAVAAARFDGVNDLAEVEIAGDWAFARGELVVNITTPDGKQMKRSGSALAIFRRGPDRKWRIARDANLLGGAM